MSLDNKMNFKSVLKGTLFSLLLTIVFVLIITVVGYFGTIDEKLISILLFVAAVLSILVGSFIISRLVENRGMLHGGLMGIIYFLVILASSFVLKGEFGISTRTVIMFFAYICTGMLGGIIGINTAK